MSVRGTIFTSAIAIGAALIAAPAAAQTEQRRTYQLEAQDLDSALRSVGRTSNSEIFFETEIVAGKRARALNGQYTPREAIEVLIKGSNLVVLERRGAVIIRERFPASQTELTGNDALVDHDIIVTGSRIRGAPVTSPVTTITRQDAERSGQTDLGQIIRDLPQNFSGGQNPTISAAGQGGFTNVSGSSALNLRGLGPDASLTLFNGHRVAFDAVSQGVDISAIPLSAIERIDIVTDGASALYGSDAVAGVANVILRRRVDQVVASTRLAGTTEGGGFTQQYNLVAGPSWASGSLMAAIDYQKFDEINARQRAYARNLPPDATLIPAQRQVSIVTAGRQNIGTTIGLEVDGHYMHRSTSRCITASISPSCYGQGSVVRSTVESWSVTPSLLWEIGSGWNIRLSGTYGESDTSIGTRVFFNNAEVSLAFPRYTNDLKAIEIGAEGRLFSLPGGDARIAIGGGTRSSKLRVDSRRFVGGVESPFDIFNEKRRVNFAYGEVSLPLVSAVNSLAFVDKLHLVGAYRFEDHKNIGRVTTPKIGGLYSPLRGVEFKVSWGRSFKIPTLYQTGQTSNAQLLPGFIFSPPPSSTAPILYLFGGNPDLAPERATTLTTSLTLEPVAVDGLRLDVGYFRIRYRNRVAAPFSPITSALLPVYADFVQLSPSSERVVSAIGSISGVFENSSGQAFDPGAVSAILDNRLQNISLQSLRGIDGSIKYSRDLDDSDKIVVNGGLTYLESTRQITADLPEMAQAGLIFRPPHWRGRFSAGWEQANVSLTVVGNYVGSMKDDRFQPITKVGSFVTVDTVLHVSGRAGGGILNGTSLTIGVQNLFNERPQTIRSIDPAALRYDSINHSTLGRTFSITISKAW